MSRTAKPQLDIHQTSKLLMRTTLKPVKLNLPPAHSFQQFTLMNAWEVRSHPNEKALNSAFDAANPTPITAWAVPVWCKDNIETLPLRFPGLRFVIGACGTKGPLPQATA